MESLLLRLGNEVRETLYHVTGLIGLAAEEPLSENQSQYLARSLDSARELVRKVNDLAELARGAGVAPPAAFVLADALSEIAGLMGILALQKGLTFDWRIDGPVPHSIAGDKVLIQDLLGRLVDNAIRFTPHGGVQVLVTADQAGPSNMVFKIGDSGPGIPEEVLAALESPLTASPLQGLGLRIVRKRVADLGGSLSIASEIYGTTVRLTLPVLAAAEVGGPAAAASATSGGGTGPLRLLVAEDSDESFLLFQAYTLGEGHQVVRAHDGLAAVEMAQRGDYDFIVMDANMPAMDGYAATRTIREWETNAGHARRPILLLSSDDLEVQMRKGGPAGCSGYLPKPASKAQILAALAYYARPSLEAPARTDGDTPGGIC